MINPNSDVSVTDHLRSVALSVLPAGSEVEAMTCAASPLVIETSTDGVLAAVGVLKAALAASDPDAFLVGCFGAPAMMALREVTRAPVVGLGAAALVQAETVTSRFGVITTLDRGVPSLWSQLDGAGVARSCVGIVAAFPAGEHGGADPSFEAPEHDPGVVEKLLFEHGRELVAAGAVGIVLACASFSPMSASLSGALGVPVCDGVIVGACLAHGLWASGVWTSKTGAYAWGDAAWARPDPA